MHKNEYVCENNTPKCIASGETACEHQRKLHTNMYGDM